MDPPSSPALRSLQVTSDGKTLVGRSPCTKSKPNGSPSVGQRRTKVATKSSKKITSFFPSGTKTADKPIIVSPLEETEKHDISSSKTSVDVGINTELTLAHLDVWTVLNDSDEVMEKLYSTGPTDTYWKTCADEIRRELDDAVLEKLACDDELETLMEEKRALEEEIEEYKEYYELREYSDSILMGIGRQQDHEVPVSPQ